ncbi:helix-turn-helix domain-containing protein [Pararoseomonas indoligenes]|uniref:Helix-turn-helix domain-containing protein n=1 Tax=Roseomonas indoligenes TaxID=2820811 RepID=A0A940SAE9_9PROT|nr:helix-turn-helix domain-containing protein [Pararoseomonas indoligenes]MBP0496122.1 helix-turn-helix domain-containing protein [Pararoseomonas indoligenes]
MTEALTAASAHSAPRPESGGGSKAGPRLERLRAIASAVNAGGGIETILAQVLRAICRDEPWARGGIMAVNRESGFSERVTHYDPAGIPAGSPGRWALTTSPVIQVTETRRPLVIEDAQHSPGFPGYQEDARSRGYSTVALLPLGCTTEEGHEMVLSLHTRERIEVTGEELDFLTTVAHLVALAVEKVKHLQREQRQSDRLRRILEAGAGLMELVLEGAALSAVAGLAGATLAHPMAILDFITGQTLARGSPAPETLDERGWRDLAQSGAGPVLAALARGAPPGEVAFLDLTPFGLPPALPVLAEPLRVDGETAGLLLVFPREGVMDSLDRVAVQEVRFALAAQLMRHHAEAKREAQDLSEFLEQLVRTGGAEPARARARAARLGLDLGRGMRLLAVALPRPGAEPAELRRIIAGSLGRAIPGALTIEQGDTAAILLPEPDGPVPDTVLERLLAAPVRARLGARPVIALGPLCSAPGHYGPGWAECGRVLELARMFGRDGLVRQGDFGPSALLLSAFDGALVRAFVDGTLGPIRRHEAGHGGGLLETATVFIDEACRYQASAERLGIHVSTLRYRLRRLEELFGLDLEDAETRFRFSLAVRLTMVGPGSSESRDEAAPPARRRSSAGGPASPES